MNIFALGSNFPVSNGLVIQQEKLWLNVAVLVQPLDSDYYRIEIDFPRWFSAVEVIVWQAERNEIPVEEIDLKLAQNDFKSILDKLNNLPNINIES